MTSKFSEAYRHLKATDGTNTNSQDGNEETGASAKSASRSSDSSTRLAALKTDTDRAAVKAMPLQRSIEIDWSGLAEAGLLPADDKEVVARQFKRIKRPIINNAFDFGIMRGENANVAMIASALPGAGKSFTSINLALSVARERDLNCILVDADVLKPNCSRALGLEGEAGLIDYLLDENVDCNDVLLATDQKGLQVLPAGSLSDESTELLASHRMQALVADLSQRYKNSLIFFDTPPLLLTNEAQVLAQNMGQIIFVIQEGVSQQSSVNDALALLDRDKPINVVLNKASGKATKGYGDGYYGYYASKD